MLSIAATKTGPRPRYTNDSVNGSNPVPDSRTFYCSFHIQASKIYPLDDLANPTDVRDC